MPARRKSPRARAASPGPGSARKRASASQNLSPARTKSPAAAQPSERTSPSDALDGLSPSRRASAKSIALAAATSAGPSAEQRGRAAQDLTRNHLLAFGGCAAATCAALAAVAWCFGVAWDDVPSVDYAWRAWVEEPASKLVGGDATWAKYVVLVVGTFVVHEAAWLITNVPYILIDAFDLFPAYRITSGPRTGMNSTDGQVKELKRIGWGHVVQLLPIVSLGSPLLFALGFTTSAETLPTLGRFGFQFLVFNIIEDAGFYWVHRWMHTPNMYRKVHYLHHKYDPPFSLVGEISHPVEFLLNILLPLVAGPIILAYVQGVHIATFWVWISFREMRGTDAHSDVNLPFHPLRLLDLIYGGPRYHSVHHKRSTKNSNYGGYLFWDWLCGTTIHPEDPRFTGE